MQVDVELRKIVAEMFDLMYEARGVGLAANQVELPLRLFVVNMAAEDDQGEEPQQHRDNCSYGTPVPVL